MPRPIGFIEKGSQLVASHLVETTASPPDVTMNGFDVFARNLRNDGLRQIAKLGGDFSISLFVDFAEDLPVTMQSERTAARSVSPRGQALPPPSGEPAPASGDG